MKQIKTLFLIYNANSGLMNLAIDSLHKMFSPQTYACNLCSITHGFIGVKQEWANFTRELDYNIVYLHKDEWEKQEGSSMHYPSIFISENNTFKEVLNAEQINKMKLKDLIHFLKHLDT